MAAGLGGPCRKWCRCPRTRPRPPTPSYRGDGVDLRIDPQTWAGLKTVAAGAQRNGVDGLQAVMAVVMHRAEVGDDIALGTPIAGRNDQALDRSGRVLRQHLGALRVGLDCPAAVQRRRRPGASKGAGRATQTRMCRSSCWWSASTRLGPRRTIRCSRWPWSTRTTCALEVTLEGAGIEPMSMVTCTAKFDLDVDIGRCPTRSRVR